MLTILSGAIDAANAHLGRLNRYLCDHTFLVGERLSLADLATFAVLVQVFSTHPQVVSDLLSLTRYLKCVWANGTSLLYTSFVSFPCSFGSKGLAYRYYFILSPRWCKA